MLAQAAGFALLAAISPTALLVMAVYLGSASPRSTALLYVTGAVVMTVVSVVVALVVIRATGLNHPRQHDARYGLRLGLGVLAAGAAALVALRKRAAPDPDRPKQGILSRLIARPSPGTAFVTGLVLFAPSATLIAAVQVVATSHASIPTMALALAIVVTLAVLVAWLPLVAYLAAPDATGVRLKALNAWLRAHGRMLLITALSGAAAALVVSGALGLAARA